MRDIDLPGISRNPRPNRGGLPFARGMTPCLSIHLPMAELLGSGQVIQDGYDGDTSVASLSSSITYT